ncbi:MAG: BACON domain-containing protein, partial [Phycisphaerales bacterium]
VTGLTNGTAYTIALRAVNSMGEGAASSAVSATPTLCANSSLGYEDLRINAAGGESAVELISSGTCSWTATSNAAWLVLDGSSVSGTGEANLIFTVGANATTATRTATITVTGSFASPLTFTVTQTRTGLTAGWGLPKYGLNAPPAGESTMSFASASANRRNNSAVRADGTVVVWGLDTDGQTNVPAALANPATANVIQVATGQRHVLALQSDGTVVAWGRNADGQCDVPVGLSAISIAAGRAHSLAVRSNGTVAAWGRNQVGQCDVPVGLTGVIEVSAGDWHSVALKSDGTVVAWGDDTWGQATVPSGLTGVSMISAGRNHTLALKSDGTVVAWGDDRQGQSTVRADLQNPATANVVQVSGGRTSSVALKADGTIVYWGTTPNGSGTTPSGVANVMAIAAGDDATLALVPPSVTPPNTAGGSLGGGAVGATVLVPEQYPTIGEAIASAGEGSTILVTAGVYRERLDLGDRGLQLVAIGGAGEVVLDARGQQGPAISIASVSGASSGLVTRVSGFTILGGDAVFGGGVLVDRAVAEVVECVIRENRAEIGGGVSVLFGDLLIEACVIESNVAEAFGGGVHASASSLMLLNTTIAENLAGVAGGGVWADEESIVLGEGVSLCGNLPDEAAFEGDLPPEPPRACPVLGDLDGDGVVGSSDLSLMLAAWGRCESCEADLDRDGDVDGADLSMLMSGWLAGVGGEA